MLQNPGLVRECSDKQLLTLDGSQSEQDSSVRVFDISQAASMQFGAIECLHESVCQTRDLVCIRRCPLHWH
jgi:hypothetical protein